MFSSFDSLFIMPACYHPTTAILVDDNANFLKNISLLFSEKLSLLTFADPAKAIAHVKSGHKFMPFTSRCLIEKDDGITLNFTAIRNEIYNANRFKEILISITDFDMPNITGKELIDQMEFPREIAHYAHILLTGKPASEFQDKLSSKIAVIKKDDPDYINQITTLIEKMSASLFQWFSYVPARILSRNPQEKAYFLFDGKFVQTLNSHIKENKICELYLFDKQGSYLFLDADANLSWMFVRNEMGIDNTIKLATEHGAPKSVLEALKNRDVILSLYEKEDIENKKNINWDKYLIPATKYESDDEFLGFFPDLMPSGEEGKRATYYYAFTKDFPENGIDTNKILSYRKFLLDAD